MSSTRPHPMEHRQEAVVVETDGMPKDRMSRGLEERSPGITTAVHLATQPSNIGEVGKIRENM